MPLPVLTRQFWNLDDLSRGCYAPGELLILDWVYRRYFNLSGQAADIQIQVSLKDLLKPETKGKQAAGEIHERLSE